MTREMRVHFALLIGLTDAWTTPALRQSVHTLPRSKIPLAPIVLSDAMPPPPSPPPPPLWVRRESADDGDLQGDGLEWLASVMLIITVTPIALAVRIISWSWQKRTVRALIAVTLLVKPLREVVRSRVANAIEAVLSKLGR